MSGVFELRSEPLSVDEVIAHVRSDDAGGVAVFMGTVRNHNRGRRVTLLEYEAYASMAAREMAAIAGEIEREMPGVRLSALHRVGRLEIGDVAVVCGASAAHRGEAFKACRLLIDRIKERVPIWKREHGPDGPYWVDWEDARCSPEEAEHHGHARSSHDR